MFNTNRKDHLWLWLSGRLSVNNNGFKSHATRSDLAQIGSLYIAPSHSAVWADNEQWWIFL